MQLFGTTGQAKILSRDKGTMGQKFLHCPGTKGQWDKLKILPRAGTGRAGTVRYEILTVCPVDGTKRDREEKGILKQEKDVLKQKMTF